MADNVTTYEDNTLPASNVYKTDEIASVHWPCVKTAFGSDGSATLVDASNGLPVAQQGTWTIVNISGTISLPTGAATAAKQPALGVAGTPSADVITIQGAGGGTAVPVSIGATVTCDTELPAAAVLADGASNPTAPAVGSHILIWNGTTWDRLKGDTTNGAWVNVKALPALPTGSNVIGAVTQSGSWAVTVSGTVTVDTELAAAAAAADGASNPTAPFVQGALCLYNGTTWDRWKGDATKGAKVQIVDGSGTQITSFGGGSQYAIDAAAGGSDNGTVPIHKRVDTLATITPANGDWAPPLLDSLGRVWIVGQATQTQTNDAITNTTGSTSNSTEIISLGTKGVTFAVSLLNDTTGPTSEAIATLQFRYDGSATWRNDKSRRFGCGLTANADDGRVWFLPPGPRYRVQVTGNTGQTVFAQVTASTVDKS